MATLTNWEVLDRWTRDLANNNELGPPDKRSYNGATISVDREQNAVVYHRPSRPSRRRGRDRTEEVPPTVLGRWLPKHRTFLLNGNGFTDRSLNDWQGALRERANTASIPPRLARWEPQPRYPATRVMLVPFLALEGAEIVQESIRPIAIEQDRFEMVYHRVTGATPSTSMWEVTDDSGGRRRTWTAESGGRRFRVQTAATEQWTEIATGRVMAWRPWGVRIEEWRREFVFDPLISPGTTHFRARMEVWGVDPITRVGDWRRIEWNHTRDTDDTGKPVRGHGWWQRVHHLGASLFSAVGEDGKRHKFISAFDEQEPNQMYFLAQLPDRSGATTYAEALAALAPPIVHAAEAQGRRVFRQGDVFAVETNLTDEDVYGRARTRVRREVAFHRDLTVRGHQLEQGTVPITHADEIGRDEDCPCCGGTRRIGWTEEARRALMIYGTGHTASEVVVAKGGTTYIRGIMHHDPHLEDPDRRREHVDVRLGDAPTELGEEQTDRKWYLAVRNTVPRRRSRPAPDIVLVESDGTVAVAA